MRELQRKLDYDAKMQQFFSVKGNRRQNADLEQREAFKKQQQQQHFQQKIDDYTRLLENIHVIRSANHLKKNSKSSYDCFPYFSRCRMSRTHKNWPSTSRSKRRKTLHCSAM